ncbi:MAG: hypothetical protein ABIH83_01470 [Candidatus Micrarchaeota archaeon]
MNIIPKREKIGVGIATADRHILTKYLRGMQNEFKKNNMNAIFSLASSGEMKLNSKKEFEKAFKNIKILEENVPIGQSVINAINSVEKETNKIIITCDDFDHLIKEMPKLANKIGGKYQMVLGSWDKDAHIYLPFPLFINEVAMSVAVTYSNEKHPADLMMAYDTRLENYYENYLKFKKNSVEEGSWVQIYIGLIGLMSNVWKEMVETGNKIFKGLDDWHNVGFEAGVTVAAREAGISIGLMKVPKRWEHPVYSKDSENYKKDVEAYKTGRQNQFKSGISVVKYYIKQKSAKKLATIEKFEKNIINLLGESDFYWPGNENRPIPTIWNTYNDVTSTFNQK